MTMQLTAWFKLSTRLTAAEETYRRLAADAFERNDFAAAARHKLFADGIRHARDEMRDLEDAAKQAVGSATQPTPPAETADTLTT